MKTPDEILGTIDQTFLKPPGTRQDLEEFLTAASAHPFASVCVFPDAVPAAVQLLKDWQIPVCTVSGFPTGAHTTESKVFETVWSIENGASEIDMVMNIGEARSGNWNLVRQDIAAVAAVCRDSGVLCKVIIETCYLSQHGKEEACRAVMDGGADFVKTSTGFGPSGADPGDVALLSRITGGSGVRVKA